MESPESGRPVAAAMAMDFPASDGGLSCTPPTMPTWLSRRLSDPKTPPLATVEEIEAKLRDADLRRQKFYENLSGKARQKTRRTCRSSSHEDDLGERLKAKIQAAEEKRLSILSNAQMRLAKVDELRQAAKTEAKVRFNKERAELGTKVEMRIQQAEANRLLILRAYHQKRATLKERASQSLMRRVARESKYKEQVCDAICRKRAAAEKKRLGLLEAKKRRARARVLQVQEVASSVILKQEIERIEMNKKLEDRFKRARRKRAEYIVQRGRKHNTVHYSWNTVHEQADTLSRKLARSWREFTKLRKTTTHLAKVFNELNINERSVKSMPFEQLALLIQSPATLRTAKPLLDRVESHYKLSQAVGSAPDPSSSGDIYHLLKRVASPKAFSSTEERKVASVSQGAATPVKLSRYQVRIVLCAYMIVGHPNAVISGQGECETALVKSAGKFVQEFESLIKIILNGPLHVSNVKSDNELVTRGTFRLQLVAFDSAWCSFLNSFVVWKAKDSRSLEEDLIQAACRLELSMIQTCKMTPEGVGGPLSCDMNAVQKQVSQDQKLLREKVLHLSGDAGIERMEIALSDIRMKLFNDNPVMQVSQDQKLLREKVLHLSGDAGIECMEIALSDIRMKLFNGRENRSSVTSLASSSSGSSDKASNLAVAAPKQISVAQSLFRDLVNTKEVNSTASSDRISQSSGESLDKKNVMIVNEYVHGEHLAFGDSPSSSCEYRNIMEKWKETMEKAFWDGVVESVEQDTPNYSHVVKLMIEVRDEIYVMAPHSWRQEIFEAIDLEILTQLLNSGRLDIDYLGKIFDSALIALWKLSAPAYEDELKRKHQQFMKELAQTYTASDNPENSLVVALIKGLRFVLQQIQELKQEICKARIRMLEPFLKGPEALYYLGKSFTNCYGHPSDALIALPVTAKWLSSVRGGKDEEWNEYKNSLSQLVKRHEGSSSFLPSSTLQTGGSLLVKMRVNEADACPTSKATNYLETIDPNSECKGEEIDLLVRLGLIKLVSKIAGLTEAELPETMNLNLSRLRSVQSHFQRIIVIATSLLVLRQTLLSEHIVTSQSHVESILLSSSKRLSNCLDSVADAGIQDIIDKLCTAIEEDNKFDDMKLQAIKEIMARMLTKSLQEEDSVFTQVSQTVCLAAKRVLLGGTGKQGRALAEMALQKVGAALLLDEVVQAASTLVVTAKVSVIVHGPWYANLIKE